ncbi:MULTISPECIES: hypothetical protein [unclassified Nostoc]|uniref:hypothetical protein n=1 Tax=unclassified Nostoc TaxID=2593658 RepID=UPI000B952919|nr:hypothetical protein [Nostoc sp. 'Peltigera membranacea cyanobiont' 232]OYE06185.1 hypothetical protein CDG79_03375 [Nostoc sp. 'Peltigera membranacea cyanobiont' 232]
MKNTAKYSKACQRLTFPHQTQDELYAELNRLGWYWQADKKEWERDDTPAQSATKLIKIRVWAAKEIVEDAAELFSETAESNGLRLIEKSSPYPCRPPKQLESRIYLVFEDITKDEK